MTSRTFISRTCLMLLFSAAFPSLRAQELATSEKARIEALISYLESLKDAIFVRNGREYDAASAAKFLRGKWHANESEIKSTGDFIAKAATESSTTGKPYLLRLKGQHETTCAALLTAQLEKMKADPVPDSEPSSNVPLKKQIPIRQKAKL